MKISTLILLAVLAGLSTSSCFLGDDEIFLLPKGHRGLVLVILNQHNGEKIRYEDTKKRVYEIPENGILKTQFTPNTDSHHPDKYFYVENEQRIEIPYVDDPRQLRDDTIQVCCFSFGRAGKAPNVNNILAEYYEFYVGTKADIDKAMEKSNKIDPADLVEPSK